MAEETAKKEIEGRFRALLDLASKRDAEAAIKYYTEDAVFMHNGHPTKRGRKDILQHLKKFLPYCKTFASVTFELFDITSDNVAFIKCLISVTDQEGKVLSIEHSSLLWRKIDGEWLIDRDMFLFAKCDEMQYEESARKEIQVKTDFMFEALNKGDIDTSLTTYAEDTKVAISFDETYEGKSGVREFMKKRIAEFPILKPKQVYFELLNNETVYLNNEVDSVDEKTGKIKKSYRDTMMWKRKNGAGWLIQLIVITDEPER